MSKRDALTYAGRHTDRGGVQEAPLLLHGGPGPGQEMRQGRIFCRREVRYPLSLTLSLSPRTFIGNKIKLITANLAAVASSCVIMRHYVTTMMTYGILDFLK